MKEYEKHIAVARLLGHKYVYKITAKCEWLNYFWVGFITSERSLCVGAAVEPPDIPPIMRKIYQKQRQKEEKAEYRPREWRIIQIKTYQEPENIS